MRSLLTILSILVLSSLPFLAGCSAFTSIQREELTGKYVITGWQAPGPRGFVWICDYDPKTKTLHVEKELPR